MIAVTWIVTSLVIAMAAVWCVGVRRWLRMRTQTANSAKLPSVDVIVVARNEEGYLEACLRSILRNDYAAGKLSVMCVDDQSSDGTRSILATLSREHCEKLSVLDAPTAPLDWAPKKRAIYCAIQQSNSEIVLLTDADIEVPTTWVRSMVKEFEHQTGAVIGASIPRTPTSLIEVVYRFERLFVNFAMCSAVGWGKPASACGHNIAYRRTALLDLKEFPQAQLRSGDDDLVVQEVARLGWNVKFAAAPESVVTDCRVPTVEQDLQAAVRHQSTVRYYPIQWRVAYALSIVSHALLLFVSLLSLPMPVLLPIIAVGWAGKLVCEIPTAMVLFRRLSINVKSLDLVIASLVLLPYSVIKPLLTVVPTYTWKGRRQAVSLS